MRYLAVGCLALLGACAGAPDPATAAANPVRTADWRTIATPADRGRIRTWRSGWLAALARARAAGNGAAIDAEGALLQPDAALGDAAPPPGDYRCRTTKLGAKVPGGRDFTRYPVFDCRIAREGDLLSFAKLDGSQRPVGLLFPGGGRRLIFLGTMMLSDERTPLDYGRDPERDMAGALERVGERRWRLALPWPHWESMLDVIELVPA